MTEVKFRYFADPEHFAFMKDGIVTCHFCKEKRLCLDGAHFYGEDEIEAVCLECMSQGKLKELDIAVNDIDRSELTGNREEVDAIVEEIVCRTPAVPTWQDSMWPVRGGKPYRFIKIASRTDYMRGKSEEEAKRIFTESLHDCENDDVDWLWSMVPEHPIRNIQEGQYDLSFYLFEEEGDLLTTWDAN